jgi:Fe2+ transport system protein FeoA
MTLFDRIFFKGGALDRRKSECEGVLSLADVPAGEKVCVCGFISGLSAEQRSHLQAYGILPGHCVKILQHSPVTIVQIEHMELALENGLARYVQVEVA